jgi:hypothetical protein
MILKPLLATFTAIADEIHTLQIWKSEAGIKKKE